MSNWQVGCLDSVRPARIPNDAVLRSHDLEDGRDLTMKNNQSITKNGDWTRMEASMNGFIYTYIYNIHICLYIRDLFTRKNVSFYREIKRFMKNVP